MKDSCHEASLKDVEMIFQTLPSLSHVDLLQIDKHPSSLRDTFKRNCFRRPRSKQTPDLMRAEQTREKLLRKLLEDLFTFSHFLPVFANKIEKKTKLPLSIPGRWLRWYFTSTSRSIKITQRVINIDIRFHSLCFGKIYLAIVKQALPLQGHVWRFFHPFVLVPSIKKIYFANFHAFFLIIFRSA